MAETFKCPVEECGREFKKQVHLGRHLTATHGFAGKGKTKKEKKETKKKETENQNGDQKIEKKEKKSKKLKKRMKKSKKAIKKSKRRVKALDSCINGVTFNEAYDAIIHNLGIIAEHYKNMETESKIYQRDLEKVKSEMNRFTNFAESVAKSGSVLSKIMK